MHNQELVDPIDNGTIGYQNEPSMNDSQIVTGKKLNKQLKLSYRKRNLKRVMISTGLDNILHDMSILSYH